jgi:transmembrane sensor
MLDDSMHDDMIVRVLQDTASDIEKRQVLEWRAASVRNARHYQELATVWRLTGQHRPAGALLHPPTPSAIIARAGRRGATPGSRRPRKRMVVIASALAAALLVAVGLHVMRHTMPLRERDSPFVARELTTNADEMVTVRLDDGTVVRLGPNSHLRFGAPSYGPREVSLEGRAYFAVAKAAGRPFRVHTSAGEARVLGTRFELRTDNRKDLRLLVIQGRVELDAGAARAEVHAGQMSRVVRGAPPVVTPAANAFAAVDRWVGRVIFFEASPLDDVARELSAHYHRHVTLADASLAYRTITASFINRRFDDVLTVVCRVADVRCVSHGTSTTISRE